MLSDRTRKYRVTSAECRVRVRYSGTSYIKLFSSISALGTRHSALLTAPYDEHLRSGSPLRVAHDDQAPRFYARRDCDACARDRREHRHFQPRQRGPAQTAALSEAGAVDDALAARARAQRSGVG